MSSFLHALSRVAAVARRVVGAPDYERYVAHVRARHPGVEPVGFEEFYRARLEERYNRPGARCC
ncbi:MAG: YbdD/YjiX family protein [Gemmatimonadaceae bacterium]